MPFTRFSAASPRIFRQTAFVVNPPPTSDADTGILTLTPDSTEAYTPSVPTIDSNTLSLALTPSSAETTQDVDSGTVALGLTPVAPAGGVFPSAPILDTFTDASAPRVLATYDPTNWGGIFVNGEFQWETKAGNVAGPDPSGVVNSASYYKTVNVADVEVYTTVTTVPSSGNFIELAARIQNPASPTLMNCYVLAVFNNGDWWILNCVNGTFSLLSTLGNFGLSAGDQIGMSIIGTSLKFFKNGTQVASYTDGSVTGAGYIGLRNNADNTLRIDNFGGGAPVASGIVETAQFVDSGTVALGLTPSVAEIAQEVEVGTTVVTLTPSGVEVQGREYFDSVTIGLKFTPNSTLNPSSGLRGEAAVFIDGVGLQGTAALISDVGGSQVFASAAGFAQIGGSFTAIANAHMIALDLGVSKFGSPIDSLIAELRTDSGSGGPPTNTVLASASIVGANLGTSSNALTRFPMEYDLVVGTKYWIVLRRSGSFDGSNAYRYAAVGYNSDPNEQFRIFNSGTTIWGASSSIDRLVYGALTRIPSAEGYLTLTPSGSDTYIPLTGVAYTDSGTIPLNLAASAIEVAVFVEPLAATSLTLVPSASEAGAFVEASTVGLVTVPSAAEVLASTDTQTSIVTLTPSVTEFRTITDASTANVVFTPNVAETIQAVDAITASIVFTPSASDTAQLVDTSVASVILTPTSIDVAQLVDTTTAKVLFTPSVAESVQLVDSTTAVVKFTPSVTEFREITDAGAAAVLFTPSSADVTVNVDSATTSVVFSPSATEFLSGTGLDTATIPFKLTSSASEVFTAVDQATTPVGLYPSSTDIPIYIDAGAANVVFSVSSTDVAQLVDSATIPVGLTPSGTDVRVAAGLTDAATANVVFTPTYVDTYERLDADTSFVSFVPSSVEAATFGDSFVSFVKFVPGGVEVPVYAEAATAKVIFSPNGVEFVRAAIFTQDEATVMVLFYPSGVERVIAKHIVAMFTGKMESYRYRGAAVGSLKGKTPSNGTPKFTKVWR